MKRLSLLLLILTFALLPAAAGELQDSTVRYALTPQIDKENAKKVEKELRRDKGVARVEASAETQLVTIWFNPAKTSPDSFLKAIEKCGYTASPLTDDMIAPVPAGGPATPPRPRPNAEAATAEKDNCSGHECEHQSPHCGQHQKGVPHMRHNSGNIEGAYQEQGTTSEPRRATE